MIDRIHSLANEVSNSAAIHANQMENDRAYAGNASPLSVAYQGILKFAVLALRTIDNTINGGNQ